MNTENIYDLRINAYGKVEVMGFGFIEVMLSLSLCESESIRIVRVTGKSGKRMTLRYVDNDSRYIDYINKNYNK